MAAANVNGDNGRVRQNKITLDKGDIGNEITLNAEPSIKAGK